MNPYYFVAWLFGTFVVSAFFGLMAAVNGLTNDGKVYYGWDAAWRIGSGCALGIVFISAFVWVIVTLISYGNDWRRPHRRSK